MHQAAQIGGLDRLVGDHGKTGAALDLVHQGREVAADIGVEAGFPDQRGGDRGVAPRRSEDHGALGRCAGFHCVTSTLLLQQRLALADINRNAAQHALKTVQRIADGQAAAVDAIFADRRFMRAGALLDDRHRAPHRAQRLEIAQQDHGIGEIGDIDRRLHVADQSVLRHRHEGRRALPVQILQQFVHVQDQRIFLGHRRLIAVEAVDHHGLDLVLVDPPADAMGELARRQFGGVDLLDEQLAAALHRLEIDAESLHARKQQAEFLVEHEQRRLLATRDGGDDEHDRDQRFAGAGRTEHQRARTGFDAAAQQLVELGDAARQSCRGRIGCDVPTPPAAETR